MLLGLPMLRIFQKTDAEYGARLGALCDRNAGLSDDIEAAARKVIAEVRAGGDAAVRALTATFDKRELDASGAARRPSWDALAAQVAPEVRGALEHAAARVRAFHERERNGPRSSRSTRAGSGSAAASTRSRASASTSPAARRAIRRRCS